MVIPFARRTEPSRPVPPLRNRPGANSDPVPLVGNTDPWAWLLAASLNIDLWKLARFNELMAQACAPVHLGRMFRDPSYAFDCLSQAHATGVRELQALAVEMLEPYQQLEQRRRGDNVARLDFWRH
jgi:hypothetical protein